MFVFIAFGDKKICFLVQSYKEEGHFRCIFYILLCGERVEV